VTENVGTGHKNIKLLGEKNVGQDGSDHPYLYGGAISRVVLRLRLTYKSMATLLGVKQSSPPPKRLIATVIVNISTGNQIASPRGAWWPLCCLALSIGVSVDTSGNKVFAFATRFQGRSMRGTTMDSARIPADRRRRMCCLAARAEAAHPLPIEWQVSTTCCRHRYRSCSGSITGQVICGFRTDRVPYTPDLRGTRNR